MADPKNRWIVCEEYASRPFAEGAAAKRLGEIRSGQARGDRRTCRYPHAVVISSGKPVTVADRNRELRETEDRQAAGGLAPAQEESTVND